MKTPFDAPWLLLLLLATSACRETPCEADPECLPLTTCVGDECDGVTLEPLSCRAPAPEELRLNELLADPSGQDINGDGSPDAFDDEFVEIVSLANDPVNLDGVALTVNGKVRTVLRPRCLGPRDALVIFGGGEPALEHSAALVADHSLKLTNSGALVALVAPDGTVHDEFSYTKEADGPRSLARQPDRIGEWGRHVELEATSEHWVSHSAGRCNNLGLFPDCEAPTEPKPGTTDPTCPAVSEGELIINEVLADPGTMDTNGDGEASWRDDEFVEIVLVADGERDLSAVELVVGDHTKAVLPPGCHGPRATFVIFGGGTGLPPRDGVSSWAADKGLGLTNDGTEVLLVRTGVTLAGLGYGPEGGRDESLTRYPDGDTSGLFVQHSTVSEELRASPGACTTGDILPACLETFDRRGLSRAEPDPME